MSKLLIDPIPEFSPAPPVPGMSEPALRFPCSTGQAGFWAQEWLSPGNPASNIAVRWKLLGRVSPDELEHAFDAIILRHEILRTAFSEIDGAPWQTVLPPLPFKIRRVDLSSFAGAALEDEVLQHSRSDARLAFNLTKPPLLRVTQLVLSGGESVLLLTVHHIVCDGWSIGIIAREMGEFFRARRHGGVPRVDELPLQYGDYCLWEQAWLASLALEDAAAFWRKRLSGFRAAEILPDRPRLPVRQDNGAIATVLLERSATATMADIAREQGCTLFAVAAAALMLLLRRYTGETDLSIGTQVAGRDQAEIENLIGIFINTLIIRVDIAGNPTVGDWLLLVQNAISSAVEHAQLPLGRLIEIIKPKRDVSRHALVGINFIFQRSFVENADYGAFRLVDLPSIAVGAMYDLNFFMVERPEGWRLSCEFNTDLYEETTVRQLLRHFEGALRGIAGDPKRHLTDVSFVDDQERRELIERAAIAPVDLAAIAPLAAASGFPGHIDRCYVTDHDGALVPRGGIGALVIGADNVDLPGWTPDPFAGRAPAMIFNTGVRARRTAQGALEIFPSAPPSSDPLKLARPAAAPLNDMESQLTGIWQEVLGLQAVNPDEDFFELGGHSMTAARLLQRVEAVFGHRVGIATLFQYPTIRRLATIIGHVDTPAAGLSQIVRVNEQGRQSPLIAINNTGIFYALAKRLGPDLPVTLLQLFDPSFQESFDHRSFEQIAADYARLIRQIQPSGPYTLMGWCLGGALAFEVACQLASEDGVAPRVIMVDTWAPGYFRRMPKFFAWLADHNYRWQLFFSDIRGLRSGRMTRQEFLANRPSLGKLLRQLGFKIDRNEKTALLGAATPQSIEFDQRLLAHLKSATRNYTPKPFDGEILAFRSATEPRGLFLKDDMGWGAYAIAGVSVVTIEGDHFSVFRDPGVGQMANRIMERSA